MCNVYNIWADLIKAWKKKRVPKMRAEAGHGRARAEPEQSRASPDRARPFQAEPGGTRPRRAEPRRALVMTSRGELSRARSEPSQSRAEPQPR